MPTLLLRAHKLILRRPSFATINTEWNETEELRSFFLNSHEDCSLKKRRVVLTGIRIAQGLFQTMLYAVDIEYSPRHLQTKEYCNWKKKRHYFHLDFRGPKVCFRQYNFFMRVCRIVEESGYNKSLSHKTPGKALLKASFHRTNYKNHLKPSCLSHQVSITIAWCFSILWQWLNMHRIGEGWGGGPNKTNHCATWETFNYLQKQLCLFQYYACDKYHW